MSRNRGINDEAFLCCYDHHEGFKMKEELVVMMSTRVTVAERGERGSEGHGKVPLSSRHLEMQGERGQRGNTAGQAADEFMLKGCGCARDTGSGWTV